MSGVSTCTTKCHGEKKHSQKENEKSKDWFTDMHALLTIESPRLCLLGSRSHPIGNLDGGTSASNHHKTQCFALNYGLQIVVRK